MVDGLVRVVAPMADTPAARAGLQSGDLIVRFDDQPVLGMALTDAISRMRGEPGTPIALMIRRAGRDDEFSVSLVREIIRTAGAALEHGRRRAGAAPRELHGFGVGSAGEGHRRRDCRTAAPRAVVLDMRGNGGGLLRQAVMTADAFLGEGDIVSVRGRTAAQPAHLAGRRASSCSPACRWWC